MAARPRTELPQPYPRALYMEGAKRGKPKPQRERRTVVLATALAAYLVYASTIYV